MGATDDDQKIIDGYLHVRYTPPCVHTIGDSVAPIILTDLRSGSYILLNRNGTVKSPSKPQYKSEQGKATLEAVLKDSSLMKQVVARPACPGPDSEWLVSEPKFCSGLDGWPDRDAVDIGEPPIPKVGISRDDPTRGTCMGHGLRGTYCLLMGVGDRTCEDSENWNAFAGAETYSMRIGSRNHV